MKDVEAHRITAAARAGMPFDPRWTRTPDDNVVLPFGDALCPHLLALIRSAGGPARDLIVRQLVSERGHDDEVVRLEGVRLRIFRHVRRHRGGPLRVSLTPVAELGGRDGDAAYSRGTLSLRDVRMAATLRAAAVGRALGDVVDLPAAFTGARAPITRIHGGDAGSPDRLGLVIATRATTARLSDLGAMTDDDG